MKKTQKFDIDGILLLDKPPLLSSNGVLKQAQHLYHAKKAGHMGCLDPLATGMLPVCFGEATKFAQYGLDADKCYAVTACFGITTNTGDAEGEILTRVQETISREAVVQAMPTLVGDLAQTPPMFSALKYQGKKLYELARTGIVVPREARAITIHEFTLTDFEYPYAQFTVHCSKGTYIRTLIEDLGALLRVGAHVSQLRRLFTAGFEQERMFSLEELRAMPTNELAHCLLPVDTLLAHVPIVIVSAPDLHKLYQGQKLDLARHPASDCLRLYDEHQVFHGIGEWDDAGLFKAKRMLASML